MDSQQKRMLIFGIGMVLFGCIIGLVPPPMVQHFRSLVTSHIEFTSNGMLLCIIAFCMPFLNYGSGMKKFIELNAYLGTFFNGFAFLISAVTGFGTALAPTVHEKFPFPHGITGFYSEVVTGCLLLCAVTIILALALTFFGLIMAKTDNKAGKTN